MYTTITLKANAKVALDTIAREENKSVFEGRDDALIAKCEKYLSWLKSEIERRGEEFSTPCVIKPRT